MPRQIEAEARILGGLPVIVVGRIYPAEPDVGIFNEQPEVEDICWTTGKSIPDHMWKRISQDELDACANALLDGGTDYAADLADYRHDQWSDRQMERAAESYVPAIGGAA